MSVFSKPRTIRVWPNPYAALDHKGRPSGAFAHEPGPRDLRVSFVGAVRTAEKIRDAEVVMVGGRSFVGRPAAHDRSHEFTPGPVEVLNTPYYHAAIRSRDLIAGDLEAWTEAGLPASMFIEPKQALQLAKEGALAAQKKAYGETSPHLENHWAEFHGPKSPAASASKLARKEKDQ